MRRWILVAFAISYFGVSWADNQYARFISLGNAAPIKGLRWEASRAEIYKKGKTFYFKIKGNLNRPGWSLMAGDGKPLVLEKGAESTESETPFELRHRIRGEITYIEIIAVGPKGEVERETFTVDYPGWRER